MDVWESSGGVGLGRHETDWKIDYFPLAFPPMPPDRRRKLLIVTMLLSVLIAWDTTLGPDSGAWAVRAMRADPPKLPPSERPAGSMRVLFIGNSFTRYWGGQVLI